MTKIEIILASGGKAKDITGAPKPFSLIIDTYLRDAKARKVYNK